YALGNRVAAQRWPNGAVFNDGDRGRESALTQHDGEVSGFLRGKTPGNDCHAVRNRHFNRGGREDGIVEHNSQVSTNVLARHLLKELRTTTNKAHPNFILPVGMRFSPSFPHHIPSHGGPPIHKEPSSINELTGARIFLFHREELHARRWGCGGRRRLRLDQL